MSDLGKEHLIAVTCVVINDGRFLIARRAPTEKHFPNKWTIPGGKMEANDYSNRQKDTIDAWYNVLEDVARREIFEETGLKIKNIRYLTNLVFIRNDGAHVFTMSLYANYDSGQVKLDPSLSEYAWVNIEEAKKYDLIDGIREELGMISKILKGEKVGEWQK